MRICISLVIETSSSSIFSFYHAFAIFSYRSNLFSRSPLQNFLSHNSLHLYVTFFLFFLSVTISAHFSVTLSNISCTLHSPCPQLLKIIFPRFLITDKLIHIQSHNISFHTDFSLQPEDNFINTQTAPSLFCCSLFHSVAPTLILNTLWIIFVSEKQTCSTFRKKKVLLSTSKSSGQRRVALNLETARYSETAIYQSTRRSVPEELILERKVCPCNNWPTYHDLRA